MSEFQKGNEYAFENGNTYGFKKGNKLAANSKDFQKTVKRALIQEDYKRLRASVETMLDLAAKGERWACELLRDTLDGRPAMSLVTEDDDGNQRPVTLVVYAPPQLPAQTVPAADTEVPRLGHQEGSSRLAS